MRARLRIGLAWIAVIGACLLLPAPVTRAADDGGTRSVFAAGVGSRGLALGGAFASVADDASAVFWNPAGYGWITRRQVQVSRGTDNLDFGESFAAVAWPDWRWGTVAASARHFGTDGIEQRDARNVLLNDDLQDSETEFAFGYGRAFGPAWSLGASAKLQRQSLAGYVGSALGADLGVTVRPLSAIGSNAPWSDRLAVALAVRNAIAPSIRLDRESVPDPTTVRTGMSWHERFGLAAIEIEKAPDVGARLHAGLELVPHPLMALRIGSDNGTLTAGAGMHWQDLSIDYAFVDAALSPSHRVGVTWAFGATVDESRAMAQQQEQERLQAQLAERFQQMQRDQIRELLARAEQERAAGHYEEARDALSVAVTLDPDNADARALETRCMGEQAASLERSGDLTAAAATWAQLAQRNPADTLAAAGVQRCRAESDRRAARNVEIRGDFARAMTAFAAADLAAARTGFTRVLEASPGDADAALMLRRTETAIVVRGERLLEQARHEISDGRLDAASTSLGKVRALDSRAQGLAGADAALQRARQSVRATPPPAARGELSPQKRRDIDDAYRRGVAAMQQKRPDEAVRYFEIVWAADPRYQQVSEYLKREYLIRGLEAFSAGRLDDATAKWELALRVDPTDERVKGYLARAQEQRLRTRQILGAAE